MYISPHHMPAGQKLPPPSVPLNPNQFSSLIFHVLIRCDGAPYQMVSREREGKSEGGRWERDYSPGMWLLDWSLVNYECRQVSYVVWDVHQVLLIYGCTDLSMAGSSIKPWSNHFLLFSDHEIENVMFRYRDNLMHSWWGSRDWVIMLKITCLHFAIM